MNETAEQYIARISGMVGEQDPLTVMKSTPSRIAELLKPLTPQQMDFRPAPGKWTIRQQVAHLADAEIVISTRVRWAAAEPGKPIMGYDQDKWAATGKYAEIPVELSLATLTFARRWTLEFLEHLTPAEKNGYIQHEERGKETIPHLLKMVAGHDLNHLKQISDLAKQSAGKG